MKIVQTCWACNQKDLLRFNAGWRSAEYHLMAWALSCLQLKKYYHEVVLYADKVTATTLIDILKLPYDQVVCDLDQFNQYSPELWALPKIYTYSQQTAPFLHVDGDVFIWSAFEGKLLKGELIAQNLEIGTSRYRKLFENLERQFVSHSAIINDQPEKNKFIHAYNAGILGGNDLDFFHCYTSEAKKLIRNNESILTKIEIPSFNIYFEQYLFYCLSVKLQKKVNVLLDKVIPDDKYIGFGDFTEIPHKKQYLHLIGPKYKRNLQICQQLADRLRLEYPEYYYRIIALFKNHHLSLEKDYYYFLSQPTEGLLLERYFSLLPIEPRLEFTMSGEIINQPFIPQISIVKNTLLALQKKVEFQQYDDDGIILEEARIFENQLIRIITEKFTRYSKESLYHRDIIHTKYFELLFGRQINDHEKLILADDRIEIIKTIYDWSFYDSKKIVNKSLQRINLDPSIIIFCVIPECDLKGYSLVNIDQLDFELIQLLENQSTINELLTKAINLFDPKDIEESAMEFEELIAGRIKSLLASKIIKVASPCLELEKID